MGDGCLCLGAGLGDVPVQTCSCILRGEETHSRLGKPGEVRRDSGKASNDFFLFLQDTKEAVQAERPSRVAIGTPPDWKGIPLGCEGQKEAPWILSTSPIPSLSLGPTPRQAASGLPRLLKGWREGTGIDFNSTYSGAWSLSHGGQ